MTSQFYPLIIAGTGIAGLTAAIYAARSNNNPLVLEGTEPGGQLTLTTDVANYPGFPDGVPGPELVQRMKKQAEKFGAEIAHGVIVDIEEEEHPFHVTLRDGTIYTCEALIAASGASARTLGIPGEDSLMGFGVSTCATCDGAFFRGEEMIVVGGGDAAMEEANFLTKFASTVYLVHRRQQFRAEDYWLDRTMEHVDEGNIEILRNTEVTKMQGSPDTGLQSVLLAENPEGYPSKKLGKQATNQYKMNVGAVFVAIGHTPNTQYLRDTRVEMTDNGYIHTQSEIGQDQTKTNIDGIFGAGDVVDYHYQQAVTAAGMGSKAAIDVDEYLEN